MGQQQLLLIVLGAIIVGIAIIVGLNMFQSGAVQGNLDAVTQDCMTIASRAQEWWRKPTQMGGGGRDWAGLDSTGVVNFPATTINGTYTVTPNSPNAGQITIQGVGIEDGDGDGTPLTVVVYASSATIDSTVILNR